MLKEQHILDLVHSVAFQRNTSWQTKKWVTVTYLIQDYHHI